MAKNYYIILGITDNATQDEVKSAYRRLAKELHPDHYEVSSAPFLQVQEAYSILSDPEKRREYDSSINRQRRRKGFEEVDAQEVRPRPRHVEPLDPRDDGTDLGDVFLTLSFRTYTPSFDEIFDRLWSNFSSLGHPKGEVRKNLTAEITISPEEAQQGGHARVFVPAESECPTCYGRGGVGFYQCWRCAGEGSIRGEFPIMVSYPAGIRNNHSVLIPLERFGIRNLYLTVNFRVSREVWE